MFLISNIVALNGRVVNKNIVDRYNLIYKINFYAFLINIYIKSNKCLVFLYFIATILESIIVLLSVFSIIPVINFFASEQSAQINGLLVYYFDFLSYFGISFTFVNSLLIFLCMTILSSISSILLFYISRLNGYAIVFMLRSWALYKFYGQGLSYINSYSFGIIQNTFEREINKVSDSIYSILNLFSATLFTLFMISFSVQLSQTMSILVIFSFIFIAIFASLIGKKISSLSELTVSTANTLSDKLYNPLLNAKNVLSFARNKWAYDLHSYAFKKHANAAVNSQTISFLLPEMFKTSSILVAVLALFYSLYIGEPLTLLIATLAVFIRVLPKLAAFTQAYAMIKEALPSISQYDKLFPKQKNLSDINQGKKINGFYSSIVLENVSFSFADREDVLRNVNLKIKKNSFVTFVGHSGSGKTTCTDIILGHYKPLSGSIFIDDLSLEEIDLTSLIKHYKDFFQKDKLYP